MLQVRTLNVRLAAILLAVGVVSVVGVYFLHKYQVRRNAYVFKDEAERALKQSEAAAKEKNADLEQKAYKIAANNYFWYVRLVPDDVDTQEKLGLLLADHAQQTQDRRTFSQAYGLLEGVLRQEPNRTTARRRLVELAIMAKRYQDAKAQLKEFLLRDSPKDADLLELLGRCNMGELEYDVAAENLKRAIKASPAQINAYSLLAIILRTRLSRSKEADQWMDKLVKANPKSARAHLLHGSYLRSIHSNDEALKEAQRARELAPDDREVLLLAAQCYLAAGKFGDARECAARGIKLFPDDVSMYTTMGDIELRAGNRDKALDALQDGLKATNRNPQLLWGMANVLIALNEFTKAQDLIKELRDTEYPRPFIEFLNARAEFVQGHWLAARRSFDSIRGALTALPDTLKQVDVWIGQCHGHLGDTDAAIKAFRRALDIDPFYGPAKSALTEALLASGNVDDALAELRELARMGRLPREGLINMAKLLILQTLRKPAGEQDWGPVEQLLDQAEKANPDTVQIPILRMEMLAARKRMTDADAILRAALEKHPDEPRLKEARIALAERQNNWAEAKRLLQQSRQASGDSVAQRLAQAQYLVRSKGRNASDELRPLAENLNNFSDAERLQLWGGLVNASMQVGDVEQATKLTKLIAEKAPDNVNIRYFLLEQALQAKDKEGIDRALKEVERVAGRARCGSAARQSGSACKPRTRKIPPRRVTLIKR